MDFSVGSYAFPYIHEKDVHSTHSEPLDSATVS